MRVRSFIPAFVFFAAACGSSSGGTSAPAPSAPAPATPPPVETITQLAFAVTGFSGPPVSGQSVTVPGPSTWNEIRFSWLDQNANGVAADGNTLTLMDREYLGIAKDLGPSTPGFIARSLRVEGAEFVFDAAVRLNPNTMYWFYEDGARGHVELTTDGTQDAYPGGDYYGAGGGQPNFTYAKIFRNVPGDSHFDAKFRLTGRRVSP